MRVQRAHLNLLRGNQATIVSEILTVGSGVSGGVEGSGISGGRCPSRENTEFGVSFGGFPCGFGSRAWDVKKSRLCKIQGFGLKVWV